jgi:CO/xanthine dehydrogenase FAD-binding subunit
VIHSDLATAFLAFDAVVRLTSRAGERQLPGDFMLCARSPARVIARPLSAPGGRWCRGGRRRTKSHPGPE